MTTGNAPPSPPPPSSASKDESKAAVDESAAAAQDELDNTNIMTASCTLADHNNATKPPPHQQQLESTETSTTTTATTTTATTREEEDAMLKAIAKHYHDETVDLPAADDEKLGGGQASAAAGTEHAATASARRRRRTVAAKHHHEETSVATSAPAVARGRRRTVAIGSAAAATLSEDTMEASKNSARMGNMSDSHHTCPGAYSEAFGKCMKRRGKLDYDQAYQRSSTRSNGSGGSSQLSLGTGASQRSTTNNNVLKRCESLGQKSQCSRNSTGTRTLGSYSSSSDEEDQTTNSTTSEDDRKPPAKASQESAPPLTDMRRTTSAMNALVPMPPTTAGSSISCGGASADSSSVAFSTTSSHHKELTKTSNNKKKKNKNKSFPRKSHSNRTASTCTSLSSSGGQSKSKSLSRTELELRKQALANVIQDSETFTPSQLEVSAWSNNSSNDDKRSSLLHHQRVSEITLFDSFSAEFDETTSDLEVGDHPSDNNNNKKHKKKVRTKQNTKKNNIKKSARSYNNNSYDDDDDDSDYFPILGGSTGGMMEELDDESSNDDLDDLSGVLPIAAEVVGRSQEFSISNIKLLDEETRSHIIHELMFEDSSVAISVSVAPSEYGEGIPKTIKIIEWSKTNTTPMLTRVVIIILLALAINYGVIWLNNKHNRSGSSSSEGGSGEDTTAAATSVPGSLSSATLEPTPVSLDDSVVIATVPATICYEGAPLMGESNYCPPQPLGSSVTNLVAQSRLWSIPEADISILNAGEVMAEIPQGNFTTSMARQVLPYHDNTLVTLQLEGYKIAVVLERALEKLWDDVELQEMFTSDKNNNNQTFDVGGSYPYGAGIRFDVNMSKPFPHRVSNIEVASSLQQEQQQGNMTGNMTFFNLLPEEFNGTNTTIRTTTSSWEPLNLQRLYTIVTSSYLAGGGDGYHEFHSAPNHVKVHHSELNSLTEFVAYCEQQELLQEPDWEDFSTQSYIHDDRLPY